jgi:hypothetical protein
VLALQSLDTLSDIKIKRLHFSFDWDAMSIIKTKPTLLGALFSFVNNFQ